MKRGHEMRNIGIIGGTGIYSPHTFIGFVEKIIETPYGKAKALCGEMAGNNVNFITRHGVGHTVPPHKVNYRANIWALKALGVKEIFATTAVGSLNPAMTAGHFVVCDQVLDFTKSRINTFFDSPERGVAHVDFTFPYCPRLRKKVISCLEKANIIFHSAGTYVVAEGPRFETAAEIKMFRMLGGDVVGMTNMPEAILAREAEMCYTNCSIVTNMGAGISPTPLSHSEVVEEMGKSIKNMERLILAFISANNNTDTVKCDCAEALKEFGGFKL